MKRQIARVSRRKFLKASAVAIVGAEVAPGFAKGRTATAQTGSENIKAVVFDVFGTVVDWRTSVIREVEDLAKRKALKVDAAKFADTWRDGYRPILTRVRTGALPWTKLDDLHRMILNGVLKDFAISGLSELEIDTLNRVWHRLAPWPDSVSGLTRLKKKFVIAPLSNGNISLMTDMAKHSRLPWDCILGAELVRHYKPDPEVYRSAADFLDLKFHEVMMVAAHLGDLRGAKDAGLRTAFVPRPLEFGPNGNPDLKADSSAEISAKDFNDLAKQLGA